MVEPSKPHACSNASDTCICSSILVATGFDAIVAIPYRPNSVKTINSQPMTVIEVGRFCIEILSPCRKTSYRVDAPHQELACRASRLFDKRTMRIGGRL